MSEIRSDALREFHDIEHRHAYCDEFLNVSIATQIKVLREQRTLTQKELAANTGMKQSRISALEDANYSSWSINTLRRLARAFDVTLTVTFETFGEKLSRIESFSRDSLEVSKFEDDPVFSVKPEKGYLVSDSLWAELLETPQQTTPTIGLPRADTIARTHAPEETLPVSVNSASNLDLAEAA